MAQKDLKALTGMMDVSIFDEEIFGFHVQQAVEKLFKAWIAFLGHEYPLTHDLSSLLVTLEKYGVNMEQYWNLIEYNSFAVRFRYDAVDLVDEPLDRKRTIGQVQELFNLIERQVDING